MPDNLDNWKGDFTPEEQWGEVHEVKLPMNWPQAVASTVMIICVSAVLIVLFMVLWGPW